MRHIPTGFKPATFLLKAKQNAHQIAEAFAGSGLQFPIIVKPEIGERGWLISRIDTLDQLQTYASTHQIDLLLQDYVTLPIELSIMVYSFPDGTKKGVTSICEKHFLQVVGDGNSALGQLIMDQDRAVLQFEKLWDRFGARWNEVIPAGEICILEHVGNHCRGTMFLNRNDQIDDDVVRVMEPLLRSMPDVFYGRFDLRTSSLEALKHGQDIQILEFNGTSSDPAHIYQPGYSLLQAYRDIGFHWGLMYRIAIQNRRRGHVSPGFSEIFRSLIIYFRYKRKN